MMKDLADDAMVRVMSRYREGLSLLKPLWEGRPDTPRRVAKRVALSLMEYLDEESDLLLGLVLLRAKHRSMAEHSLKVAIVSGVTLRALSLPSSLIFEAILCGLLHRLGHDTLGALARSKDYLAQRSLVTLLMTPDPEPSHYRQVLAAFQRDLGLNGAGEPRLDFPVRPSPLAMVLSVSHDFVALVSGAPQDAAPSRLTSAQALTKMRRRAGERYHPALIDLLAMVLGPVAVGECLRFRDGRYALVLRSQVSSDGKWRGRAMVLDGQAQVIDLRDDVLVQVDVVVDAREFLVLT